MNVCFLAEIKRGNCVWKPHDNTAIQSCICWNKCSSSLTHTSCFISIFCQYIYFCHLILLFVSHHVISSVFFFFVFFCFINKFILLCLKCFSVFNFNGIEYFSALTTRLSAPTYAMQYAHFERLPHLSHLIP